MALTHTHHTRAQAHSSTGHLTGNISIILLLAPMVEGRLGSRAFVGLLVFTSVVGGLANAILSSRGIIGASGIVFMLIMLTPLALSAPAAPRPPASPNGGVETVFSSLVRPATKANHLPVTFVLLFALYVGKELTLMFSDDGVSHLGHLVGGLCGAGVGLVLRSVAFHKERNAGFLSRVLGIFTNKAAQLQKKL